MTTPLASASCLPVVSSSAGDRLLLLFLSKAAVAEGVEIGGPRGLEAGPNSPMLYLLLLMARALFTWAAVINPADWLEFILAAAVTIASSIEFLLDPNGDAGSDLCLFLPSSSASAPGVLNLNFLLLFLLGRVTKAPTTSSTEDTAVSMSSKGR